MIALLSRSTPPGWCFESAIRRLPIRPIMHWFIALVFLLAPFSNVSLASQESETHIRIGVNAHRGAEKCLKRWAPMANYLSAQVPGYSYEIVPITLAEIPAAVTEKKIDFVMTNPSSYVELEANLGVVRLATLRSLRQGIPCTVFGGVIFTRADRTDINTLDDLRGKTFATASKIGFGAFRVAWRELLKNDIDPFEDFAQVIDVGFPQDNVIYAVLDGSADAGTVRTDMIERLATEGNIQRDQLRILNPLTDKLHPDYPFAHSTQLYPEWPFAKLKHTPDNLSRITVLALLTIPEDDDAAIAANIAGWTVPKDYNTVHECLKDLRVGPYVDYGKVTFYEVVQTYWVWLLTALAAFIGVICCAVYVLRLNRRITSSQHKLREELETRHRTEESLDKAQKQKQLILDSAGEGIYGLDLDGVTTFVNPAAERMLGYEPGELIGKLQHAVVHHTHQSGEKYDRECSPIYKTLDNGRVHSVDTDIFWRKDGSFFAVDYVCTPIVEKCFVVGAVVTFSDITVRKEQERERDDLQEKLLVASRQAGMAEIATDVLHNVGNVLNSVNVSATLMNQMLKKSKISRLAKTVDLLEQNNDQLGEFITNDEIGRKLPKYLASLSQILEDDRHQLLTELEGLTSNVDHIKLIVQSQQYYAKMGGVTRTIAVSKLLEEAITVRQLSLERHNIKIVREFHEAPDIEVDKHDVLKILVNLVGNAEYALNHDSQHDKLLTLRTSCCGEDRVRIEVIDNGVGIDVNNLERIFNHGFTTKESGHGFGLHSAANLAGKLGGSLTVTSEGVNQGATFILELPMNAVRQVALA